MATSEEESPGGSGESLRITETRQLKVFAHPLRYQLFRLLFMDPPATASQLAERVDETVSLVSYHLRKMAEHGFIEEVEDASSDGRERWWRPVDKKGWEFRESDFSGDPASAGVADQVMKVMLNDRMSTYAGFLAQRSAWPQEWRDAAFSGAYPAHLTAAETQRMGAELTELLRRWHQHGEAARTKGDTEGREPVEVHFYGFPVPK